MVGFDKFHDLLQQDVTRKEFLKYIGIALLSLVGIANMLQNLSGISPTQIQQNDKPSGYGSSAYGR